MNAISRIFAPGLPLVHGPHLTDELAAWAAARIPMRGRGGFGPCWAVGVVRRGALAAVVVYHDWHPDYETAQMSIASVTPRWASRAVIRELFAVPFEGRLGEPCRKVWAVTEHRNESAMAMLTRLGMRREATLPDYFARRSHAVAFGLTSRGWRAGPFGRKEA